MSALVRDYLRTFARPGNGETDSAAALFAALDRVHGLRAADRMTREEAHDR